MANPYIGDDPHFQELVDLVPVHGRLQVENLNFKGSIQEHQGKLVLKAIEFVSDPGTAYTHVDEVTFTATANVQGKIESVTIQKGPWSTRPSAIVSSKIVLEKIIRPIVALMKPRRGDHATRPL